ncbi:hypothetical protein NDU88_004318 [Pleurodeles waltl]|uniref:Uncharacterized protein n=1 Tax=Pleurodeles waltl TaxID=8319 RepID=A0AAV7VFV8_PLEWA|nr:hypothetical protein NDU88_004318 [Pleurodeles waltl]
MDGQVMEALRLLRKAGRLDLLADGGDHCARPARHTASGVAAAVAACSPPRGKRGRAPAQVRGLGLGRGGGCEASARQKAGGSVRRPRPLGAQLSVQVEAKGKEDRTGVARLAKGARGLTVRQEQNSRKGGPEAGPLGQAGASSAAHRRRAGRQARPTPHREARLGTPIPSKKKGKGRMTTALGKGRCSQLGEEQVVFVAALEVSGQDRDGWRAPRGVSNHRACWEGGPQRTVVVHGQQRAGTGATYWNGVMMQPQK